MKKTHNLKSIFRTIRNYLAGNTKGATRDETLAKELINLIFCKIYDEKYTADNEICNFRAGIGEKDTEVASRIKDIFNKVKTSYKELFDINEKIQLDNNSIRYVVGELQNYNLMETKRDVIADAFETFIGHTLKGEQGQFFTPRNVLKSLVEMLNPTKNDIVIDPACGSGGFLIESLRYIWEQIRQEKEKYNWNVSEYEVERIKVASNNIKGIENDDFLAKITKAYMILIGDGKSGISCDDSLERPEKWKEQTKHNVKMNSFDIVLTNPPFGKDIKVKVENKLKQYDLAYKWRQNDNNFIKDKLKEKEAPEILFIERCLQLLKNNGKLGIVLPDGIFNESEFYVRNWLLKQCQIIAIIDICKETFQPNTSTKTSLLILQKKNNMPQNYDIFMGVAYYCGHNRRGEKIDRDDMPLIIDAYRKWMNNEFIENTKNYFTANINDLLNTGFWIPKHYSPFYKQYTEKLKDKCKKLFEIADLKKGDEVGSDNYIDFFDRQDTDIPFLRTGDLVNFSVNQIPDKFVDISIYNELQQDLLPNDILFTKDGKIGITAMITKNDKVIISSGISRIRVKREAFDEYGITPEYLFVVLSNKWTGYFQAIRNTIIAATIPHLRENNLRNFNIPILDKKIINNITEIVKKSFELKNESNRLDKEMLKLLNDSL